MAERDGLVTREDLAAYRPRWDEPVETSYLGLRVATRGGLARLAETLAAATAAARRLTRGAGGHPGAGAPGAGRRGATRRTSSRSTAEGNACVLTTSLGLGSGDFLPGFQVHLNSMLGELDLIFEPLEAGERMESMMAPTAVFDGDGPVLAAGSAGGSRLRGALVQTLSGILDEGLEAQAAVDRPRLHPVGDLVNVEPGFEDDAFTGLEEAGFEVRRWEAPHHFFGGVSLCGREAAAADPRRSGLALPLP